MKPALSQCSILVYLDMPFINSFPMIVGWAYRLRGFLLCVESSCLILLAFWRKPQGLLPVSNHCNRWKEVGYLKFEDASLKTKGTIRKEGKRERERRKVLSFNFSRLVCLHLPSLAFSSSSIFS